MIFDGNTVILVNLRDGSMVLSLIDLDLRFGAIIGTIPAFVQPRTPHVS